MSTYKFNSFNLQLCADKDVEGQATEIPAEYADQFHGVDKDVALDVLREAGLLKTEPATEVKPDNDQTKEGQQPDVKPDESGQQTTETKTDPQQDTKKQEPGQQAQPGEQGAVKQPATGEPGEEGKGEDDKNGGDLRVALKLERERRKKAEALLKQIQQPGQFGQLPVQPAQTVPQTQQPAQQQTASYDEALHAEAVRRFEAQYQKKPDFYDPDGKDITRFQSCVRQVEREVEQYNAQRTEQQTHQQQVNNDYTSFIQDMESDDLSEVKKQRAAESLKQLQQSDPTTYEMLRSAVLRLESGRGTAQDMYIVRTHWNLINPKEQAQVQDQAEQKPATTVTPAQPKQQTPLEKAKQMEAHLKAGQVTGSNSLGGYSVAELERMLQEKDWDEIPKEIQKLLLGQ